MQTSSTQVSKSFATVLREATTSVVLTNLVSYSDLESWKLPALKCYLLVKVFFSKVTLLRVKLMQVRYMDGWWWKAEKEMYQSITKKEEKKNQIGWTTSNISGKTHSVYMWYTCHSICTHWKTLYQLETASQVMGLPCLFNVLSFTSNSLHPLPTLRCCRLQP